MIIATTILPALGLSAGGLVVAHNAWRTRTQTWAKLGITFALWMLSTVLWCRAFGLEVGIPLALETGALVAFAGILLRAEKRPPKDAKDRVTEPAAPVPYRRLKGFGRILVGGPIALGAAMAIAVYFATSAPINEQTRLVIAGLGVPALWAGLLIGALMSKHLVRTGVIYVIICALCLYLGKG